MKHAIFLYDFLGAMADPWQRAGVNVWLFDGKHPEGVTKRRNRPGHGRRYTVGIWFFHDKLEEHVAHIIDLVRSRDSAAEIVFIGGFPECTDLTNCGTRWWDAKREKNPHFQEEAAALFQLPEKLGQAVGAPYFAENPKVSALKRLYRPLNYWFDPCDYGGYLPTHHQHGKFPEIYPGRDAYRKPTGLWTGNDFVMPEKRRVEPVSRDYPGWKKLGGKSARTKEIRSATPEGFALAVFEANFKQG